MNEDQRILCIDIGGSHIKASIYNAEEEAQTDFEKTETPSPATPAAVLAAIQQLTTHFASFDKISAGFPGYIKDGIVQTAPNLGSEHWRNIDFEEMLGHAYNKPTRIVNDADLQGLGLCSGSGLEMVITLGTGFGTALTYNGSLLPHLELAHHPVAKGKTYDEYLGDKALEKIGKKKWNKRLQAAIAILQTVFNYDKLIISGGNASKINFELASNIGIENNEHALKGGVRLWREDENF